MLLAGAESGLWPQDAAVTLDSAADRHFRQGRTLWKHWRT